MRARPRDREQNPPKPLTDEEAERIVQGDTKLLVTKAQSIAQQLSSREKGTGETLRTAIRRLYREAKRIETIWATTEQREAVHRLLLLKPRLSYHVARNERLLLLKNALEPVIDKVGEERQRFRQFLDFFEAIVAYERFETEINRTR
jgi:CRISPR type III-A-associated protein Csm2